MTRPGNDVLTCGIIATLTKYDSQYSPFDLSEFEELRDPDFFQNPIQIALKP